MKDLQESYWEVSADGHPSTVVIAISEREAKERAGYRGKKGVYARCVVCQASCHEYVTGERPAWALAKVKVPVEGPVCLRCDVFLRGSESERLQKLEEAVVMLRRDIEDYGHL